MTTPPIDAANDARLSRVRQAIAERLLPPLPSAQLGEVWLAPHQREAAARLLGLMDRHRGALLADDVGLGKTYVALAVARRYAHCHVIAPAALGGMWQLALRRTASLHAQVHSLHAFSHGAPPVLAGGGRTLVIIDEAHHLRNANTARYRQVAAAVAGTDVLLLSATPLHNRTRDLRALLALFSGTRPDLLTESERAELIVRREAAEVVASGVTRPRVQRHTATRFPLSEETLSRIMALPAPLPARDGAVAGALIRMGLLRAWCSSDAALAHAVRRRRLRGATLRDALRTGVHPTNAELRAWVATDAEEQMGFPELLATGPVARGPLLEVLEQHLVALDDLADQLRREAGVDAMRARVLRQIVQRHRGTPVVAFTQYTRTVQTLYRALGDIAGVAALTGARAQIASGPIPRWEALQLFAPRSHGRPPPPPQLALHLLITTDILAEGVNLQDAGVIVHLDLPWTAALRDQRVGRCVRIGSAHTCVHVYRFAPPVAIDARLRLEQRVLRKAALARRTVTGGGRYAPADRTSALHRQLRAWCSVTPGDDRPIGDAAVPHNPDTITTPRVATPRSAAQYARVEAALTVVLYRGAPTLLAVVPRGQRWVATTRLRVVGAIVDQVELSAPSTVPSADTLRLVRRAIARWHRRVATRTLAGRAPAQLSAIQRQLLARLAALSAAMPTAERARRADELCAARDVVLAAVGPTAERTLTHWRDANAAPEQWRDPAPSAHHLPHPAPLAPTRLVPAPVLLFVPH